MLTSKKVEIALSYGCKNVIRRKFVASSMFGCVLFCCIGSGPVYADPLSWKSVGWWEIDFYPDSNGCAAFASFDGGTAFSIGLMRVDDELLFHVNLVSENWKSLEEGKEYPIDVKFGNEIPWNLDMIGTKSDPLFGIHFQIDAMSESAGLFVDEFMREINMSWSFEGNSLGVFSLKGSGLAFKEVVECQKSYNDAVSKSGDPFAGTGRGQELDPFQ
ncbi:hypothetical protein [Meridianimarinicoccus sp. MJW13]|uniref:hypothetical protein n=1 Tax=Meridianimarinicoccus sp. MJW13 TaxID=2720031 RepID=UPI001865D1C4|nr:hypothetical protein [Fluviibacterium sp. MJW13]